MFSLEQSIADRRQQMLAAGIRTPAVLDELEIHLREEIERQIKLGSTWQRAFEIAVQKIGDTNMLKNEYKKVGAENWNRPFAWAAWVLFTVSFFLPALGTASGWRCAIVSATSVSWPDFRHGNWGTIYLASLTLGNVLMITSPFLLPRLSRTADSLKWLRFSILAISILVWSYVLLLLISMQKKSDLKIGCYVWVVSFLLLCLAIFVIPNRKVRVAAT
ncbi:MAG TPA: hypothetical protein VMA13_11700 [Candidatus Saccharimonadales bacterium]|nr:hypothetical protein [Candidatus Saccharimonadales bacterium]